MNNQKKLKLDECSIILNLSTVAKLNSFSSYLSKETNIRYDLEDIIYLFLTYEIKSNMQGSCYLEEYFSEAERKEIDVEILSSFICSSDNMKYI